jgi:signal transduction histidine kinase/ActR/RegA family two-component response regulator
MSERGTSGLAAEIRAHWRTIMMVIVAALGAGVLAALIFTVGQANHERDRALTLQSHSFDVMLRARGLAETMARAEATLGRYVISADVAIGRQYSDEWTRASQQIDGLEQGVRDNSEQRGRVRALRRAYAERSGELSLVALSTRYKKNVQALTRYYAARNATSLVRIGSLLEDFIAAERTLLRDRTGAAQATIDGSNRAAKVLAMFGIAIVLGAITLGWLTVGAQTARAVADAEADAERERAVHLEAAVLAATEELQAEAREREIAEGKLRQMQKLEAGQLTGGIAHDFNNMLAVVLGGIELAKRHNRAGGDVARHLDSAAEGANRAAALTRQLLAFARVESLAPKSIEAGAVILGMSDLIDRTLGDGIRVDARDDGSRWHVWADRHGLENAILNLAVNARDAMEERGTLTITTGGTRLSAHQIGHCAEGDHVTIAVSDTGCGMSAEVIDRVFEPFFTTKPLGKGTGLGLSQIFGFVQQSGGEIEIESEPGRGCTVTLYLPRHHDVPTPTAATPAAPIEFPVQDERALDILVVEDDPRVLTATVDVLEDLGHRPVACADPMCAADEARVRHFDLILSDVLMPGKTGPELIAELAPSIPGVAVLFVTGFAGDAADHDDFGGYTVLRKPYTIAALSNAIDTAMAARSEGEPVRTAA